MIKSSDRLTGLTELSALIKERELAQLAAITAACQSTRAAITQLSQDLAARATEVEQQERPDPAALFGADERWRALILQQQASLSEQLARELTAKDIALGSARRSLGRADVLAKLAKGDRGQR